MALISCPECGKEISDRAAACPNCAFPIAAQLVTPTSTPPSPQTPPLAQTVPAPGAPSTPRRTTPKVQTIEQTGKEYKKNQALGCLTSLGGFVILLISIGGGTHAGTAAWIGGVVMFIGVLLYLTAKVGAWWEHG